MNERAELNRGRRGRSYATCTVAKMQDLAPTGSTISQAAVSFHSRAQLANGEAPSRLMNHIYYHWTSQTVRQQLHSESRLMARFCSPSPASHTEAPFKYQLISTLDI